MKKRRISAQLVALVAVIALLAGLLAGATGPMSQAAAGSPGVLGVRVAQAPAQAAQAGAAAQAAQAGTAAPAQAAPPPTQPLAGAAASTSPRVAEIRDGVLYLDGKPYYFWSGDYPYYRDNRSEWSRVLDQLKAMNIKFITFYIPWRHHAPQDPVFGTGTYDFTGATQANRDVRYFIQLLKEKGLYGVVKPGPFICAEVDYGGLPDYVEWAVRLGKIEFERDSTNFPTVWPQPLLQSIMPASLDSYYQTYVKAWLGQVDKFLAENHFLYPEGPIVGMQLLNEGIYSNARENLSGFRSYDFSPSGIRAFQRWLQQRYGTLAKYNQYHGTAYSSWNQIDAPRSWEGILTRGELDLGKLPIVSLLPIPKLDFKAIPGLNMLPFDYLDLGFLPQVPVLGDFLGTVPLLGGLIGNRPDARQDVLTYLDWGDFAAYYYGEVFKTYKSYMPRTSKQIPIVINPVPPMDYHVAGGKGAEPWITRVNAEILESAGANFGYTNWIGIAAYEAKAYAVYSFLAMRHRGMNLEDNWSYSKNSVAEMLFGSDITPFKESLPSYFGAVLFPAFGSTGLNVYTAASTDNWTKDVDTWCEPPHPPSAPIAEDGSLRSKYWIGQQLGQFFNQEGGYLVTSNYREPGIAWGIYPPYAAADAWNSDAKAWKDAGFSDVPRCGYDGVDGFQDLLKRTDTEFTMINIREEPLAELKKVKAIFLSGYDWMDRSTQDKLVEYVRQGGMLVLSDFVPYLDENFQPYTKLRDTLLYCKSKEVGLSGKEGAGDAVTVEVDGGKFTGAALWRFQSVTLSGNAKALATITKDGKKHVVGYRVPYGQGQSIYLGFHPWVNPGTNPGNLINRNKGLVDYLSATYAGARRLAWDEGDSYQVDVQEFINRESGRAYVFVLTQETAPKNYKIWYTEADGQLNSFNLNLTRNSAAIVTIKAGQIQSLVVKGVNDVDKVSASPEVKLGSGVAKAEKPCDLMVVNRPDKAGSLLVSVNDVQSGDGQTKVTIPLPKKRVPAYREGQPEEKPWRVKAVNLVAPNGAKEKLDFEQPAQEELTFTALDVRKLAQRTASGQTVQAGAQALRAESQGPVALAGEAKDTARIAQETPAPASGLNWVYEIELAPPLPEGGGGIPSFQDIAHHWARADIQYMAEQGIVQGVSPTRFEPEGKITRAQFAALVVRALGLNAEPGDASGQAKAVQTAQAVPPARAQAASTAGSQFKDVKPNYWAYEEIMAAAEHGIVNGFSDGSFKPELSITREQLAAMMARGLVASSKGELPNELQATLTLSAFDDWIYVTEGLMREVALAVDQGILKGNSRRLLPGAPATRAEATAMLRRMYDLVNGGR